MRVLHIIGSLGLGGAERMLVDLANASAADGHEVSVCVTRSDITLARDLDPRIALLVLDRRRKLSLSAALRLVSWVRRHRIEVMHVHLRHTLSYVLLLRAVFLLRTPLVFHDHYGTIEVDTSIPPWFRIGCRWIAQYVGVHDKLREWAIDAGVPSSRATTIANALDLSRLQRTSRTDLRDELGLDDSVALGIVVATVRRDKGIEMLLEAITMSRHRARLHIAVAGVIGSDPYAEACRALLEKHGLQTTVTFLGGRTDVPSLLPGVDVGLLASHTESGPLVLIEYLAAGIPIVSTHVGNIGRRLAAMGVPGFVPAGDPAAFAEALDALLDLAPPMRAERVSLGTRALAEDWDIRAIMPRWYEVYRAAVAFPK